MTTQHTIFVVDDDPTTRLIVESMLSDAYVVETFGSAAECLDRLSGGYPDVFVLDVQMPGTDGYELCRQIKTSALGSQVPVIFLSSRDTLDDVLAGYDAGAEDYVVKPFEHIGLQRKIGNLIRIEHEKHSLRQQVLSTDELVTVLMASLNDNAILIKFLRTLSDQYSADDVLNTALGVLVAYRLEGAVQIRMRDGESTKGTSGENWPMEVAVIDHLRSQGRIFEFKTRSIYNFPHVSMLVTNMPLTDPDLCGRIRDNLAIIAESTDAKLATLQANADKENMRAEISGLLDALSKAVSTYGRRYDEARYKSAEHTTRLLEQLLGTLAPLGMTAEQEEAILEQVRSQSDSLIDLFDFANDTKADLTTVKTRLETMLATAEMEADSSPPGSGV